MTRLPRCRFRKPSRRGTREINVALDARRQLTHPQLVVIATFSARHPSARRQRAPSPSPQHLPRQPSMPSKTAKLAKLDFKEKLIQSGKGGGQEALLKRLKVTH